MKRSSSAWGCKTKHSLTEAAHPATFSSVALKTHTRLAEVRKSGAFMNRKNVGCWGGGRGLVKNNSKNMHNPLLWGVGPNFSFPSRTPQFQPFFRCWVLRAVRKTNENMDFEGCVPTPGTTARKRQRQLPEAKPREQLVYYL